MVSDDGLGDSNHRPSAPKADGLNTTLASSVTIPLALYDSPNSPIVIRLDYAKNRAILLWTPTIYRIQYIPEFALHADVKLDLGRALTRSNSAVGLILAAIEAVNDDETLLSNLQSDDFRTDENAIQDVGVKRWWLADKLGMDIHRFRFFDIEDIGFKYRVIYVLDPEYDVCHILAILARNEIDYDDPENEFNLRIFNAYCGLFP